MQINIAKISVDRMPIFFHMLLPTSCTSKWYQWLRIWLARNIHFVGVNVGMSARNRHFQTNYWCISKYIHGHIYDGTKLGIYKLRDLLGWTVWLYNSNCIASISRLWWLQVIDTLPNLHYLCAGNPPVTGGFISLARTFDDSLSFAWTNYWIWDVTVPVRHNCNDMFPHYDMINNRYD